MTGGNALKFDAAGNVTAATNSIFVFDSKGNDPRPLRQGASRAVGRISPRAPADVGDRPVAARPRRVRFRARQGPGHALAPRRSARWGSRFATKSSSRAKWLTERASPGLPLPPLERQLVRPVGPGRASGPSADARDRGRLARDPRDADRHFRDHRRAGPRARVDPGGDGGRDRTADPARRTAHAVRKGRQPDGFSCGADTGACRRLRSAVSRDRGTYKESFISGMATAEALLNH